MSNMFLWWRLSNYLSWRSNSKLDIAPWIAIKNFRIQIWEQRAITTWHVGNRDVWTYLVVFLLFNFGEFLFNDLIVFYKFLNQIVVIALLGKFLRKFFNFLFQNCIFLFYFKSFFLMFILLGKWVIWQIIKRGYLIKSFIFNFPLLFYFLFRLVLKGSKVISWR